MITNEQIKKVKSLQRKSERHEHGLFVVEGRKGVEELLKSDFVLDVLYATEEPAVNVDFVKVSPKEMSRMSHLKNASSFLAVANIPELTELDFSITSVVLDRINDPGNLGTVIRTASWFGIDQIICSPDSVDCYNSKVVMSTMGAIYNVNIYYVEISDFLQKSKLPSYAAVFDGEDINQVKFEEKCNIIMGSESHGLEEKYLDLIKHKVTIPGTTNVESLNLSISFGIICSAYFNCIRK